MGTDGSRTGGAGEGGECDRGGGDRHGEPHGYTHESNLSRERNRWSAALTGARPA